MARVNHQVHSIILLRCFLNFTFVVAHCTYSGSLSQNTQKSSGLENINSNVINVAFELLKPEVTFMYNLSISTTHFPNSWKNALVIPIPKKGNLTTVQNYRPISLLPLPGKIMGKLIHHHLANHLDNGSHLAEEQQSFRKAHSTVHAVAQVTGHVTSGFHRFQESL